MHYLCEPGEIINSTEMCKRHGSLRKYCSCFYWPKRRKRKGENWGLEIENKVQLKTEGLINHSATVCSLVCLFVCLFISLLIPFVHLFARSCVRSITRLLVLSFFAMWLLQKRWMYLAAKDQMVRGNKMVSIGQVGFA